MVLKRLLGRGYIEIRGEVVRIDDKITMVRGDNGVLCEYSRALSGNSYMQPPLLTKGDHVKLRFRKAIPVRYAYEDGSPPESVIVVYEPKYRKVPR